MDYAFNKVVALEETLALLLAGNTDKTVCVVALVESMKAAETPLVVQPVRVVKLSITLLCAP